MNYERSVGNKIMFRKPSRCRRTAVKLPATLLIMVIMFGLPTLIQLEQAEAHFGLSCLLKKHRVLRTQTITTFKGTSPPTEDYRMAMCSSCRSTRANTIHQFIWKDKFEKIRTHYEHKPLIGGSWSYSHYHDASWVLVGGKWFIVVCNGSWWL